MNKLLSIGLLFLTFALFAQPNTEVYLLDIHAKDGKISLSNLRNISNNEGYDNQPSFYDDNTILFSSTQNGQTDIAKYEIGSGEISWLTDTPVGSEYSPLRIPNSYDISAIRLDSTGLQRLYRYDRLTGQSEELLKDLKVGYHVWYNEHILVYTVLIEDRMDLHVTNFEGEISYLVQKNVGRALHHIPNSNQVSFISKEANGHAVLSLNPITGKTAALQGLPNEVADICWLPDGRLIFPAGNSIVAVDPKSAETSSTIHVFKEEEINSISRMAVSADGKHMAIVSEASPALIVQKQVDSYNATNIEAFVNCFSENVLVRKFPDDTLYVGREKMRKNYSGLSQGKKVYEVEVVKRIVIGNKVIDHEKVTGNGKIQMQVAVYEVDNGTISSMTFIFDDSSAPNPETIVQTQLDAYNKRDIEGFLQTYTQDIKLYNFPNELKSEGIEKMREGYSGYFESTPDLYCEIKNRIVIGNKVIDEEYITANGNNFSAVAIYEIENGKIAKVTFLR